MPSLAPITPAGTIAVAVTATSAATVLPVKTGSQIVVTSPSANAIAFVAFGASTTVVVVPTTEANGYPILPGTVQTLTVAPGATHVACIGSVSSTLYFTRGEGE